MGRIVKRVPLNFSWPIGEIWAGYKNPFYWAKDADKITDDIKDKYGEDFPEVDPPKGKGYQLWETTTEGSPQSPVFKTLDELCAWCETNATTFADFTATKEQWKEMFMQNFVRAEVKKGDDTLIFT